MKRALVQTIIVVLLCGSVFAVDPNISWIKGETPPDFDRYPAEPTTSDVISFTIPTDVYGNQWEAEQALGGTPTITLDPVERRIEVLIEGPAPTDPHPEIYDPVCGLKGYFGPLDQGQWVLYVQYPGSIYIDGIYVSDAPPAPVISGTIKDVYNQGIGNVVLIFSNDAGTAYTNTDGYYFHTVPNNWYGTVTPVKGDYLFDPASRTYNHVTSNRTNQNYLGYLTPVQEKGPVTFIGTAFKNQEQTGGSPQTYQIPVGIDDVLDDPNSMLNNITDIDVLYKKQLDIRPNTFGKVYVFGYYNKTTDPDLVDTTFVPYFILRLGDVSANGVINSNDAFYIEGYLIGIWDLTPEQFWAADVNGDGNVDELDEDLISQYADGLIDNFPADSGITPPPVNQYYAEQFTSGTDAFDLENKSITFTPVPNSTDYSVGIKAISYLPVDPELGTNLGMGDDSVAQIILSNQAEVSIYGNNFNSFYVTSNGFLTFTQPDSDYSETIEDHFDTLRISALFTDLDPSANGQINGLQLNDRVVISWYEVPAYNSSDTNTFQVEMFYDGRIRLSWLNIGVQKCIVGLSDGMGVPVNFQETDFSKLLPPPASDYFTEQFYQSGDPFDLSYKSLTLTPTSDESSYTITMEDITELPVDYFGSFNLNLDDDDYEHITLTHPTKVRLFGTRYPDFYVGSNGYITFTEGDIDHNESLTDHFDLARISGLFDDLNPSGGGRVGWKQISQSVVVTWENVPEYDSSNTNTFQIEMFFNGTIRISWLDISAKDGIVGLSEGLGLLPGFTETDFSTY